MPEKGLAMVLYVLRPNTTFESNRNRVSMTVLPSVAPKWLYGSKDEPNNLPADNYNADPITNSASFKYKSSIIGKIPNNNNDDNNTKDVEIVVPLKYLSNFLRILDMPLINCEIYFAVPAKVDPSIPVKPEINAPTNVTFEITDPKLYVPAVTLSTKDDNKLLEQLKTGFKITIKWNRYRSEMTNQTKSDNLIYIIDPAFSKVNRLFVLSFKNEDDRASFNKYYTPTVEIKDYDVVIDGKCFFDVQIKNKTETYQKIIEMSRNNDYTTGNLLDYDHFSENYKLIAIDLRKQMELEDADTMQQINFIGKLERNEGATMFFIIEKTEDPVSII